MSTNDSTTIMDATVEDYYHDLDQWLRRFPHMTFARWKLLQQTAISLVVAYLAVEAGADATIAIGVIALINGISVVDVLSVWGGGSGAPPAEPDSATQNELPESEKENDAKQR